MNDSEIIAQLKREPAEELRRLQRKPYAWKVEHERTTFTLLNEA